MDKEQLHDARTNPDFLKYLEKTRVDAIATKNIQALYEVLDSFLILDIEENRVNEVYQHILQISSQNVEKILEEGKKLSLEEDDLCYVRAFYEHAVEKWSYEDFEGAKQILFVLSHIVDDEVLSDALDAHIIAISNKRNLDSFYSTEVNLSETNDDEKYGYFITNFNYDLKGHLNHNKDTLEKEYQNLKHLLED